MKGVVVYVVENLQDGKTDFWKGFESAQHAIDWLNKSLHRNVNYTVQMFELGPVVPTLSYFDTVETVERVEKRLFKIAE